MNTTPLLRDHVRAASTVLVATSFLLAGPARAADPVKEARDTVAVFKKTDPGISKFFEEAAGYAVFPTIGKGAIGLQLGGQSCSEVVFLETVAALNDFKKGNFALAAQASAGGQKFGVEPFDAGKK